MDNGQLHFIGHQYSLIEAYHCHVGAINSVMNGIFPVWTTGKTINPFFLPFAVRNCKNVCYQYVQIMQGSLGTTAIDQMVYMMLFFDFWWNWKLNLEIPLYI